MKELSEAANRRRNDYYSLAESAKFIPEQHELEVKDAIALADAYLAEHLEDDDEPLTQEWINSMDVVCDEEGRMWLHGVEAAMNDSGESATVWDVCEKCRHRNFVQRIKTRGQLRRLCAGLDIELKPR